MKPKVLLDRIFDLPGNRLAIPLIRYENDIAALYIRLNVAKPERRVERSQRIHLDHVIAANIHAAEHGDQDRHVNSECKWEPRRCAKILGKTYSSGPCSFGPGGDSGSLEALSSILRSSGEKRFLKSGDSIARWRASGGIARND